MSTLVKGTRAQKAKPRELEKSDSVLLTEAAVRHYTAAEIEELKLLPCSARWLLQRAYRREVPFTAVAGKITWRLDQVLEISRSFDSAPLRMARSA